MKNNFPLSIFLGIRIIVSTTIALVMAFTSCKVEKQSIDQTRMNRNGVTNEKQQLINERSPNFIVVLCDNLGYGDIGPFGSTKIRTPFLDQMAREGRIFTHFNVTAGVCTASRASFMTGCYSQRVGMHWNPNGERVLHPVSNYGLHPDEITVAEVLKEQGYKTGIIGKWHLGDQPPFLPTAQGFDSFFGIPYSDDMTEAVGKQFGERFNGYLWPPLPLMENEKVVESGVNRNLLTKIYTERVIEFISDNSRNPFFLYLAHAMPGSTKESFASESFRGKSLGGSWGDSVEELDWSLGQIMLKLRELGIAENTLLMFTSDNGAPMTEDVSSIERGTNRPLHGRGYTTAEGAFRVPTIMWWPGTIPEATVCNDLVSSMDILPTFAALSGAKVPDDRIIDGYDISSLILGKEMSSSLYEVYYYYYTSQLQAVRSGSWKLFVPLKQFSHHPHFNEGGSSDPLLFNVVEDISSSNNVADKYPEVVQQLLVLAERGRNDLGDLDRPGINQRERGRVENPVPIIK